MIWGSLTILVEDLIEDGGFRRASSFLFCSLRSIRNTCTIKYCFIFMFKWALFLFWVLSLELKSKKINLYYSVHTVLYISPWNNLKFFSHVRYVFILMRHPETFVVQEMNEPNVAYFIIQLKAIINKCDISHHGCDSF